MVFGLSPILINIGYDINRKGLLVIVWGGLRGAVSLSLALVVVQSQGILDRSTGSKVSIYSIKAGCLEYTYLYFLLFFVTLSTYLTLLMWRD